MQHGPCEPAAAAQPERFEGCFEDLMCQSSYYIYKDCSGAGVVRAGCRCARHTCFAESNTAAHMRDGTTLGCSCHTVDRAWCCDCLSQSACSGSCATVENARHSSSAGRIAESSLLDLPSATPVHPPKLLLHKENTHPHKGNTHPHKGNTHPHRDTSSHVGQQVHQPQRHQLTETNITLLRQPKLDRPVRHPAAAAAADNSRRLGSCAACCCCCIQ